MTNEQKQVIISGVLGDGHLRSNGSILLSCIHKEYMDLKAVLLGDIVSPSGVYARENNGYKKGIIYRVDSVANDYGKKLYKGSLEEAIKDIDELGLSLWFLDDGSLHKKNFFYNISTHSFPLKEQTEVLVPLLNRFGIYPKIYSETKKDGRQFNYLYVSKYQGAFKISEMISKLEMECYNYKILPAHLLRNYNKVVERFKGNKINPITMSNLINRDDFDEALDRANVNKEGLVNLTPFKKLTKSDKEIKL